MRFSKHYFNEADNKSFIPDPSSVGKSSTGEHIWQKDDYLINRWVKKGLFALGKAIGKGFQKTPKIKKANANAEKFTFREVTRAAFETVGTSLSKDYMGKDKSQRLYITGMYNVDVDNDDAIFKIGKRPEKSKSGKLYNQMLSSDMYVASNGGRIILVSILNNDDEIQYYIGTDDNGKVYFAYKFGKSFESYASSKRPRVIKGKSDRPKLDRESKGSLSTQIIRALTGEEPDKDILDDEDIDVKSTEKIKSGKDELASAIKGDDEATDLIQKASELVPNKNKSTKNNEDDDCETGSHGCNIGDK